jgi:hypothetical protein
MAAGIYYKGDLYAQRYENGLLLPEMIGPFDAQKFTTKANSELIERQTKGRDNHGLLGGSVGKNQPTDLGFSFGEVESELMAMLFLGFLEALNISEGSVTGEPVKLVKNVFVKTKSRNISSVVIGALVPGTDFIENKRIGAIKALTDAAVGDQSANYAYSAISGVRIYGGTRSKIDVALTFDGVNLETDEDVFLRVPKATMVPSSDIDLLPDGYVIPEMEGKAVKLPGEAGEIIFEPVVSYA